MDTGFFVSVGIRGAHRVDFAAKSMPLNGASAVARNRAVSAPHRSMFRRMAFVWAVVLGIALSASGANATCSEHSCPMPHVVDTPRPPPPPPAVTNPPAADDAAPLKGERFATDPTAPPITLDPISDPIATQSPPQPGWVPIEPPYSIRRAAPVQSNLNLRPTDRPNPAFEKRQAFAAYPSPEPRPARALQSTSWPGHGERPRRSVQDWSPPAPQIPPGFVTCLFSTDYIHPVSCPAPHRNEPR
jgi:hypothetical protein